MMQRLQQKIATLDETDLFFQTPLKTMIGKQTVPLHVSSLNKLEETLRQAFEKASPHTLVIGALPFDHHQSPALHLCDNVEINNRAQFNGEEAPAATIAATRVQAYPPKKTFEQMVQRAVSRMQQSTLQKVVLARTLEIEADEIPYKAILQYLATHHPKGYTYAIPLANGEQFIGASPELLIRKFGQHFVANPIAGSRKRTFDVEKDRAQAEELMASAKDLHEHQIVVSMVKSVLEPFAKTLVVPATPSIIYTDTMIHLSTMIEGELKEAMSSLSLARLLHPTPAVCGEPRQAAFETIQQIEPFDRGYFAGIVGYMDRHGDGEWVVAIRCGKVHATGMTLYAGAGIVDTSSPSAEAAETGAKFQTMLHAIHDQQSKGVISK